MGRAVLGLVVAAAVAAPAWADGIGDMLKCKRMLEPFTESVEICTAALNSGDLTERHIADTLMTRGFLYYRLGELDVALRDLNLSIDYNPEVAQAYYYKGLIFEALGEDQRADGQFRNAYLYAPDDPEIAAKMAVRALLN